MKEKIIPKLEFRIVTKLRKYGKCPKAHPY